MTSPDNPTPDKTHGAGIAGYYQNANPSTIGAANNSWFNQLMGLFQNNLINGLLGGFLNVPAAVMSGIGSIAEAITGHLGAGLADLAGWSREVHDGMTDLTERTDLLSALEDFGALYAPGQGEILNTGKVPFNTQIGPMTGCHQSSNGLVLDKAGLWKIDCRLAFGFTIAPGGGGAVWEARIIHEATGSVFASRVDQFNSTAEQTRQLTFPIVIPSGGYRVEVHITGLILGRGMRGGSRWNGLAAHHISHSTDHPIAE